MRKEKNSSDSGSPSFISLQRCVLSWLAGSLASKSLGLCSTVSLASFLAAFRVHLARCTPEKRGQVPVVFPALPEENDLVLSIEKLVLFPSGRRLELPTPHNLHNTSSLSFSSQVRHGYSILTQAVFSPSSFIRCPRSVPRPLRILDQASFPFFYAVYRIVSGAGSVSVLDRRDLVT